ncbi:MAG: MMPL family transporter [Planctomycetota bacterium]|nr:MMPL family transporter [Planctomycetota bacterium]MDA1177800.1 MMPL family transporter [Planctomycetota bacterium]
MFLRLGQFVARFWWAVIGGWMLLAFLSLWLAPRWEDVTYDGDLAYLPADTSTAQAELLLDQAFPDSRVRSQIVFVLARDGESLTSDDRSYADRLARHCLNMAGVARWNQSLEFQALAEKSATSTADVATTQRWARRAELSREDALEAFDNAIALDSSFAAALHNRAIVCAAVGDTAEAEADRVRAWELSPDLEKLENQLVPEATDLRPLRQVWSYDTPVIGKKMDSRDGQATLVMLQLSSEFMATENIALLQRLAAMLKESPDLQQRPAGLQLAMTGSASVGGDMLQSAAESIKHTELYTVVIILVILLFVYRAPLLIAVPLVTIFVSLIIATRLLAALTQVHLLPGMEWWDFKVFTTTKIFIVVILFGAGTDFCLFIIARYREELETEKDRLQALIRASAAVGDALTASAFTTILGLGTMFFAEFGKFRNSGPAIGFCLLVTLLACLTFAPAMLVAVRNIVFWPQTVAKQAQALPSRTMRFWEQAADWIMCYPGRILACSILAMLPLAWVGLHVDVTYDFLSELEPNRPSKIGSDLLRRHFPIGESGPVIVLAQKASGGFDSHDGEKAITDLTRLLREQSGVAIVRSLSQPMGVEPTRASVMNSARIVTKNHPLVRAIYLSDVPALEGHVTRFELVCDADPFSVAAIDMVDNIEHVLQDVSQNKKSFWADTKFLVAGTTAGIRDLRLVTEADQVRIQVLVVLAVFAVLIVILRRPMVCLYMTVSVLFSYLVTIGATEIFFQHLYGDTFQGLDWKVPLFLFVILVAIGQDYNVYLATRVFEEQAKLGPMKGLREAISRTGGIITSCGVIMAGTFVSMMSGSLRGIAELGFALSLGVILDAFVVRPILMPAFLTILFRRQERIEHRKSRVPNLHFPPRSGEETTLSTQVDSVGR